MSDYQEDSSRTAEAGQNDADMGAEPVVVYTAFTEEEAEIVRATLQASGISAFLQAASANPMSGAIDGRVDSMQINGVLVPAANAKESLAILSAVPLTDEEIEAAEEADPTTLAQAEERARLAP